VCGIAAGWTRPYSAPTADALEELRTNDREDEESDARLRVAKLRVQMIRRLRKIDKWKERFLRAGWVCQVGGLLLSAAAVRVLLTEM
jgi:hypothetical protein